MQIAGIVLKWIRGKKEINYRRIEPLIREAAEGGAKIVITTECFLDGYAIADKTIPLEEYRDMGEEIPGGGFCEKLASLAGELGIYIAAGIHEREGEKDFNSAILFDPEGRLIGKYHKQRLGHEGVRHTPGSESPTFETAFGRIGLMICADRGTPDITRSLRHNGAELVICLSGGAFGPVRNDPRLQERSRENGIYIVFVHPVEFLVTGPEGEICSRTVLDDPTRRGEALLIPEEEIGSGTDVARIFYFDIPQGQ